MKHYTVVFTEAAEADLERIKRYIEKRFGQAGALRFTRTIIKDCLDLSNAPMRGTARPGLGKNFRRIGAANGRVSLLFEVDEANVTILGIRYGGRERSSRA